MIAASAMRCAVTVRSAAREVSIQSWTFCLLDRDLDGRNRLADHQIALLSLLTPAAFSTESTS